MNQTLTRACGLQLIYTCSPVAAEGAQSIGCFRYQLGYALGKYLNEHSSARPDYIVPVPNSGLYYAMGTAAAMGIPYVQALVKRDTQLRTFPQTDPQRRSRMIQENMQLLPGFLEGKRVALVDEAIFTGTTLKVICQMLRRRGVAEIHLFIPTSPCVRRCPHGCMPHKELLAMRIPPEDMAAYFEVEEAAFLPYEQFQAFTAHFQPVCLDCFYSNGISDLHN